MNSSTTTAIPTIMYEYEEIVLFATSYQSIHAYIAVPLCVVGVVVNILNVTVLSRKELRSATNFFLLTIAICHIVLNAVYLVYLIYQNFVFPDKCDPHRHTLTYLTATLAFAHITLTAHGLSTWLTVDLAAVRCLQLRTKDQVYSEPVIAFKTFLVTLAGVFVICTPNYVCFNIMPASEPNDGCFEGSENDENSTHWRVGPSHFSESFDGLPLKFVFWFTSFAFFFLPALLLSVLIFYLISTVTSFGARRRRLGVSLPTTCWHIQHHTMMLLSVLVIFLGTQLPQGVVTLLCSFLSESFRLDVYQNLGELMELLTLINGSVSFLLYCLMSSMFRNTFRRLFCPARSTALVNNTELPLNSINTYENGVVLAAPCEKCSSGQRNNYVTELHPLISFAQNNGTMITCQQHTVVYASFAVQFPRRLSL